MGQGWDISNCVPCLEGGAAGKLYVTSGVPMAICFGIQQKVSLSEKMGYHKKCDRGIVQIVIGKYQNVGPPYRLIIEKRYKNVNNRTEKGYFVENNADNRL